MLPPEASGLLNLIDPVELLPCFALMLGFESKPNVPWDAAVVMDGPLSWLAWNQSKPGRSSSPALVVHSNNHWALEQFEAPLGESEALMRTELLERTGICASEAVASSFHRWRYALPAIEQAEGHFIDWEQRVAVCADWCHGKRVESAFLSAVSLAKVLC